jgi:fumarate reductase flavoprotein subunit
MKTLQTDVIVVAAGASGLAAAISAAQAGAKVIAFEKGATTGGAASMGMGLFGVESRLQKLKQMGPSKDEAFRIFMDYTHWRVDAQLVRAYIDKAATTIEWLENLGVEFLEPAAYFPGGAFTWHLVKPPMGGQPGPMIASAMIKTLTDRAKELGVQILLQTPVTKILKRGDRITGVVADDHSTDEPIEASAKAVIIATGGFGDNPDMIKKYIGYEWGKDLWSIRIPGLTGDGIKMAWEVGAAPTEMNIEMIYMMAGEMNPVLSMAFQQPHLMVNLLGDRFFDEGIMYNTTFTGNAIARQKNRCAFLIFDDTIKKHMETVGYDYTSVVFPFLKAPNIDELIKQAHDMKYKEVFVADSLDEMAAQTGINPEGLKKTVDQYNSFCDTGYDPVFNKKHHLLRPIRTPRFYAVRFYPSAYGSLGGIKINHRTEVIAKDWKKIPGLYAVGTDACTIYGDSYVFILPGNTMGFAINTGRIAGENAAEYARSVI